MDKFKGSYAKCYSGCGEIVILIIIYHTHDNIISSILYNLNNTSGNEMRVL
jgi:hypothetical protein